MNQSPQTKLRAALAVFPWILVAAYLVVGHVLGAVYDPKSLLDQRPNLSTAEWAELMSSPIQRAREAMIPVLSESRYIIPGLVVVALWLTWVWWIRRKREGAI